MYDEIPVLKALCGNDQFVQKSGKLVSQSGLLSSLQSIFAGVTFGANRVIWEPCSTNNHEPLMGSGAKGDPRAGVPRALVYIYIHITYTYYYIYTGDQQKKSSTSPFFLFFLPISTFSLFETKNKSPRTSVLVATRRTWNVQRLRMP